MNYDHTYHAGSFTDVFKHLVLIALIEKLTQKDKPLFYLDTHSAYPEYLLASEKAKKTQEALTGIEKLRALEKTSFPLIERYLAMQPEGKYLGSPALAAKCLRSGDRIVLNELMDPPYEALKHYFKRDARVHIHQQDAYLSLNALLPPKEKRGLILIDPPYEDAKEFEAIVVALKGAVKKFPQGVYAIWYPMKDQHRVNQFIRQMQKIEVEQLNLSCCPWKPDVGQRLSGSGMLVLNPPWQLEETLTPMIPFLEKKLA